MDVFGGAFAFAGAEQAAGLRVGGFVGYGGGGLEDSRDGFRGGMEGWEDDFEADAAGSWAVVFLCIGGWGGLAWWGL